MLEQKPEEREPCNYIIGTGIPWRIWQRGSDLI
jgi:hypothetical protein